MVEHAKVVQIIIASPSDIKAERESIPRIFDTWNNAQKDVFLKPLMFESGSVPEMGDHPQHILNKQLVEKGDLLIAIFWSKIGTPTPTAKSGTIEEIREFIKIKGPSRVMVYFCTRHLPVSPGDLDLKEIQTLNDFKDEMRTKCFYKEFTNTDKFEAILYPDLDIKVSQLLNGELLPPDSSKTTLSQDAWYDPDHPDVRLRKPIDFGTTLPEIAEGFSKRMDKFDRGDVIGKDKYLAMGVHVYWSVAQGVEQLLIVKPYDIPFSLQAKVQDIALRLRNLSTLKAIESWPEFFDGGRKISDELNDLVDLISRNE